LKEIEYKKCTKCSKLLPKTDEYFYKQKTRKKDGIYYTFQSQCKECIKRAQYKRYEENRDEINRTTYERYLANKNEYNERVKRWQKNNKEQNQTNQKRWRQENRDKLKKYNYNHLHKKHDISKEEWESCKKYFNYKCAYCGISEELAKESQGHSFHQEHAYNYGSDDLSNCVPACRSCNSRKNTFDYDVWYVEGLDVFSKDRLDKIERWLSNNNQLKA